MEMYKESAGRIVADRHSFHPFLPGIMEPTYSKEELENIDKPPFEYEGKVYSEYAASQVQRSLERTIRKWKRRLAAATNEKDKETAKAKIKILYEKYYAFSKAAGLRTQVERANVYVPGVTK